MKKIILGAILVLLLTIGFGVYYLLSNLDSIVKMAIETYGSQATQTTVKVDNVQIVLKDGSGTISGLSVGNPKGFDIPQAFLLGEIGTQINLESLSKDVFVIEHITIRAPKVFFELNQEGKNNLEKLKQNLTSGSAGAKKESAPEKSGGSEPKLIIRKLLFTDGSIQAKVTPLNKDYDLKLPSIEMNNLGGKNGATPTQIADQVLQTLTDRALAEVKKKGLDQLKEQVGERLETESKKLGEQAGEKLKGLLNK